MLLIYFFPENYRLYFVQQPISSTYLKIEGKTFIKDFGSTAANGFIGFFDWLRSSENIIVGLRICFSSDKQYSDTLNKYWYTRSAFDGQCSELLFGSSRYEADLSGDQDFSGNYVYQSGDEYVYTFMTDHLKEPELSSLLSYCNELSIEDICTAE